MKWSTSTGSAEIRERLLDVCNLSGELVGRVPIAKGQELIAAGLAAPIGRRSVKYLVLTCDEPTTERPWRGGSHTTARLRGEDGKIIASPYHVEHKPLPKLF